MKTFIEIHVLQNYAPSNLNRDDTGAPKDAFFGGRRRARISSQCLKRTVREYFKEKACNGFLEEHDLAIRTKRLPEHLVDLLIEKGHNREEAKQKVDLALTIFLGLKEGKTKYLLFLSKQEIESIATVIQKNWNDPVFNVDLKKIQDQMVKSKEKKDSLSEKEKDVLKGFKNELNKVIDEGKDGGKAVDLALFGRMLADMPEKSQYAACQVAHAISTHAIEREFDFYTALDDLKPEDIAGSDMMGTIEYNSACFYRYALVDYEKLLENLRGDNVLALKSLSFFLEGFIVATPTGKQNSFAAHNPPEYILITVRKGGFPHNLANAFEVPVQVKGEESLMRRSIKLLVEKNRKFKEAFSDGCETAFCLDLLGIQAVSGISKKSLPELIDSVIESVNPQGE